MPQKNKITLMGILNATPDSFSDGAQENLDPQQLTDKALRLIEEGADIIDIGGESTRPGASFISATEELQRIIPVLKNLRKKTTIKISIDTNKAVVAEAALNEGADIINDITAFSDPQMAEIVANHKAYAVLMHMQGNPQNMQEHPNYTDVTSEVYSYLKERTEYAQSVGIPKKRLILDPGFGFGKRFEDNCLIFKNLEKFSLLDCPILIGISRKSMIGQALKVETADRLEGSLALAVYAQLKGASIIRVHDVLATRRAVDMISIVENF